jgi:predicted metalloprotease
MFFVAFAVFLSGAIYISPMFCGSPNEKKLVSRPQEVEGGEYSSAVQVNAYSRNIFRILHTRRLRLLHGQPRAG